MQPLEGLALTEQDNELVANCQPGQPGDLARPIDPQVLQSLIEDAGYGDWAPIAGARATLVARWAAGGEAFDLALCRREDGRATVEVSADGLTAWLNFTAARGGQPLKPEALVLLLKQCDVVFGVDASALHAACESDKDLHVEVARGEPAIAGEDARFELLVDDVRTREPRVDERGLIDYHELGDIPGVLAGQGLMRRHPATPGTAGCDVLGTVLPARPGRDQAFHLPFQGVTLAPDDPNLLVAEAAGQPVQRDRGVVVEKLLHLRGVNLATGNIHFVGSVEVAGDVSPGMKVDASGDIVVKGLVDGAQLKAGGSVKVYGGVIAHSEVRAAQSVAVRFVENSSLHAGTTIAVETMALHSQLEASSQVLVGAGQGQRGRLIGGMTRAGMRVLVFSLGAAAVSLTRVLVGGNSDLQLRSLTLSQAIERARQEADKLEKLVLHLQQQGDPKQLLEKVRSTWQQELKTWADLLEKRVELDRELGQTTLAEIEMLSAVAGDVDIAFGATVRHLRAGFGAGAISIDAQEQVIYRPGGGLPSAVI